MKKNVRSSRLDDAACEKLTQDAKMNYMSDAEYINDLILSPSKTMCDPKEVIKRVYMLTRTIQEMAIPDEQKKLCWCTCGQLFWAAICVPV